MSDTIGDYYDRKQKENHAAWEKWKDALKKIEFDPSPENIRAALEEEQKFLKAANTGD